MWFAIAIHDLIVFMVYWAITYSEPFQTSKMEFFEEIVTFKETTPLLRRFRSSHRRCSVKNGVLRNFAKFTGKDLCQSPFYNKVAGFRPVTLLEKRLSHRHFRVNFEKFLRTPFIQNTSRRLLLKFEKVLNTSLLYVK